MCYQKIPKQIVQKDPVYGDGSMKFKTRLYITFASISALPIVLVTLSFLILGKVMIRLRQTGGVDDVAKLMPRSIFISLWISFFVILFVIACLLTRWIGRSVFSPINELGIGLKQVADGNFDYVLDKDTLKRFGIPPERGKDNVNVFDHFHGIGIWCSISEDEAKGVWRVSIRSASVPIDEVAEKYRGGGHAQASGAKLKNLKELDEMLKDLDALLA